MVCIVIVIDYVIDWLTDLQVGSSLLLQHRTGHRAHPVEGICLCWAADPASPHPLWSPVTDPTPAISMCRYEHFDTSSRHRLQASPNWFPVVLQCGGYSKRNLVSVYYLASLDKLRYLISSLIRTDRRECGGLDLQSTEKIRVDWPASGVTHVRNNM